MSNDENNDKLEAMAAFLTSAAALHDWFLNFLAAGFTERQAILLVAEIIRPKE